MAAFQPTFAVMKKPVRIVAISLLLALTSAVAFGAANVASDSDIGKAMNPLPADVQKSLNDNSPGAPRAAALPPPDLNPRCRQLQADIERARHGQPETIPDTYPVDRGRDGLQINSSNSVQGHGHLSGGIRYGRRAKLEDQFQRECR